MEFAYSNQVETKNHIVVIGNYNYLMSASNYRYPNPKQEIFDESNTDKSQEYDYELSLPKSIWIIINS